MWDTFSFLSYSRFVIVEDVSFASIVRVPALSIAWGTGAREERGRGWGGRWAYTSTATMPARVGEVT